MTYEMMVKRAKGMTMEQLETAKFMNDMVDRWSPNNWTWDTVLTNEIKNRNNK